MKTYNVYTAKSNFVQSQLKSDLSLALLYWYIHHGEGDLRKPHKGHIHVTLCTFQWKWWLRDWKIYYTAFYATEYIWHLPNLTSLSKHIFTLQFYFGKYVPSTINLIFPLYGRLHTYIKGYFKGSPSLHLNIFLSISLTFYIKSRFQCNTKYICSNVRCTSNKI